MAVAVPFARLVAMGVALTLRTVFVTMLVAFAVLVAVAVPFARLVAMGVALTLRTLALLPMLAMAAFITAARLIHCVAMPLAPSAVSCSPL